MIRRCDIFVCAGLRGVALHRDTIVERGLNLEVQHFVSAENLSNGVEESLQQVLSLRAGRPMRLGFHAPFKQVNYFSMSRERRERSRRALSESFVLAARLGAGFIVMHSLYVPRRRNPAYGPEWHLHVPPWLCVVASEAESLGLALAIENMLEPDPRGLLDVLDTIGTPGVSVCFDVAHAAVAGGARPAEWVEALGPALSHMHLSDNRGVHDDHMALGEGTVDLPEALSAAATLPHRVTVGVECRLWPEVNLEKSLAFLEEFMSDG